MTRKEQIMDAAMFFANKNKNNPIPYIDFVEAAEWADKTMIDRVCEYLESALEHDLGYYGAADFANTFRKAMEE